MKNTSYNYMKKQVNVQNYFFNMMIGSRKSLVKAK